MFVSLPFARAGWLLLLAKATPPAAPAAKGGWPHWPTLPSWSDLPLETMHVTAVGLAVFMLALSAVLMLRRRIGWSILLVFLSVPVLAFEWITVLALLAALKAMLWAALPWKP